MNHIFYHNDPDGWCSAAVALKFLGEQPKGWTWNEGLHECRYGMVFPWDSIRKDDVVYMLDYSLKPDEMERLGKACAYFVWIDHHVSAIKDMEGYGPFKRKTEVGKGACELTWEYFFPEKPMPRAVYLISMYDVWKLKEEPDALPFQYGIKTEKGISAPASEIWQELLADPDADNTETPALFRCSELLDVGRKIRSYQDECNEQICKRAAFETTIVPPNTVFEDSTGQYDQPALRAIACTSPMCNSMLFDSVWDPEKHDVMLSFYWDSRGFWTVSVYSTKENVDCAAIARRYGGGGHRQAAGFQCEELPFKLNKRSQ